MGSTIMPAIIKILMISQPKRAYFLKIFSGSGGITWGDNCSSIARNVTYFFQDCKIGIIVNADKSIYDVGNMTTVIIGLGNPGEKFNKTRHNAGFEALDFFAKENHFPEFELSKKYNALVSEKPFDTAQGRDDVMLVKPQTFMNESGKSVAAVMKNNQAKLVVVHDDIDVPLGKIKITQESGAGGHKGVDSIITALGTKEFLRIKIGVEVDSTQKAEDVVLEKFTPEQYETLQSVFPQIAETLNTMNETSG